MERAKQTIRDYGDPNRPVPYDEADMRDHARGATDGNAHHRTVITPSGTYSISTYPNTTIIRKR